MNASGGHETLAAAEHGKVTGDVTAVVLTIGEATLERALESLRRQTHPLADVVVVENVTPFHRALNSGAARVRTPFFVQVDADMVFDEDCVEGLLSRFEDHVGAVVCHLRDPLYGRVEAIKMYRTSCFTSTGMSDSISPDTDLHDRMHRDGWVTLYALRNHDRERGQWHTFGEHCPNYTPFFAYARHAVDGRRWRYRGNAAALRHHLQSLHASKHPAALFAHVGIAHGVFLPGENDLLVPYRPDTDFARVEALLSRAPDTGDAPLRFPSALAPLSAKRAFRTWYDHGIRIARGGTRRDLERALSRLHATLHPWAWLMQLGVCQGLFHDRFDARVFARDWAQLDVFRYYYEPAKVSARIATELRRRLHAARRDVGSRLRALRAQG